MIASNQKHTVWKTNFERQQQRSDLDLLLPSVDEVTVEHVGGKLDVASGTIAGAENFCIAVHCSHHRLAAEQAYALTRKNFEISSDN